MLELEDGRTLTQSNAILWFLGEGTDLLPGDAFARGEVAMWLSFEQERVMGGIGGPRFRALTGRPFDPARLETGRGALAHLDAHLATRDWLVGDAPTIADMGVFAYAGRAGEAAWRRRPASRRGWTACASCRASSTTTSSTPATRGPERRGRSTTDPRVESRRAARA